MDRKEMLEEIYRLPHSFKKIMSKIKPPAGATKQSITLLHAMLRADGKPMRFYSEKLMVPKSNLTVAADSLIAEGYIERLPSAEDRRIICLKITQKGRDYMDGCMNDMFKAVEKELLALSDDDIKQLYGHVLGVRKILEKIEHGVDAPCIDNSNMDNKTRQEMNK